MDIFFNGAYTWTTTLDQFGSNGPSTYPDTSLAFRILQNFSDQSHPPIHFTQATNPPNSPQQTSISAWFKSGLHPKTRNPLTIRASIDLGGYPEMALFEPRRLLRPAQQFYSLSA
jgi:hypothetical protein